jgi:hypothetical protein
MNYLGLVQRLWLECGVSGASPGPATVIGQTGESQRLVTWIDAAWNDIQTAHKDWGWMRTSASFTTVLNQAIYPLGTVAGTVGVPVANFSMWARDTGRSYNTAAGTNSERFIDYVPYDAWRNAYQFGAVRNSPSWPLQFSIAPDKSICLGPVALDGYTFTFDYFTAPTHLVADTDIPALPEWYHMALVYKAMMMYGAFEGATEVYDRGELEFGKLMQRMDADRLPEVLFGGALA